MPPHKAAPEARTLRLVLQDFVLILRLRHFLRLIHSLRDVLDSLILRLVLIHLRLCLFKQAEQAPLPTRRLRLVFEFEPILKFVLVLKHSRLRLHRLILRRIYRLSLRLILRLKALVEVEKAVQIEVILDMAEIGLVQLVIGKLEDVELIRAVRHTVEVKIVVCFLWRHLHTPSLVTHIRCLS